MDDYKENPVKVISEIIPDRVKAKDFQETMMKFMDYADEIVESSEV